MLLIPAIDLKGGRCVRLIQGRDEKSKTYSNDPAKVARRWQREGAKYLHIVDLDGAFSGEPKNLLAVKHILQAITIPVEFGGGVRDLGTIAKVLSLGVDRVILGTVAIEREELVKKAVQRFGPERIVVGIDARDGKVAVRGWKKKTSISALSLAKRMKALGLRRIIFTDIARDGMLSGPNLTSLREMALRSGLKVTASGGISSLKDILKVAQFGPQGVEGMIIGKALYEGKFTLREALNLFPAQVQVRVAAAVVEEEKLLLLLVKHEKKGKTWWCLPGGRLEPGETLEDCAKRELLEETELDIKPERIIYLGELIQPDEQLLDVIFLAKTNGGSTAKGRDPGVKAVRFVPLKDLSRTHFLPREVAKRFAKDWMTDFPEGILHLGRYKEAGTKG